jgi:hypothetical protein
MPIRAQVDGDYPNAAYQTRVRAMAETLGMFVVDPLPKFRAVSDRSSLFIPYDRMHFTGPGNALIAEAAFEALLGLPQFVRVPTSSEERRREEVR